MNRLLPMILVTSRDKWSKQNNINFFISHWPNGLPNRGIFGDQLTSKVVSDWH